MDYSRLESFILDRMSRYRIPGLSIALVRGDKVVYARGFGFRDLGRGARATPNTIYGVGSVTKSFTALSIMQLAERGLLSLEDPVEKHLPLKLRVGGGAFPHPHNF